MRNFGTYQQLMAGAAAILCVAAASPVMAQTRTFDVPAGPATRTIPIFAKQAGAQILGSATELRGKRTKAVKGTYTVEEGLRRLLEGTDLGKTSTEGGIAMIGLLQTGNGQAGSTADPDGDEAGKAEILVIGNRSRNVDVRRTENDAQPYVVFSRDEIESSQATTVEEFLRTRLTQNTAPNGAASQETGRGSNFSSFNLRGLGGTGTNGALQTLILVNGRRLPVVANQNQTPRQADINGIPVGSIERIEILPSSAGGIYGGNAVGGVINIILRSDYRGVDLTATYNDTFDFHAPYGRLDINGGFALEGGRTTVTFGGGIAKSGTLRVGNRLNLTQRGIDLYRRNVDITTLATPPASNGVNIRSTTGANLVLDPQYGGANLGSAFTTLPLGYAGVSSDNGALLRTNAGTYTLTPPDDLQGLRRGMLSSPETRSFNVNLRRKFSDLFDLFTDYSHFENRSVSYSVGTLNNSVTLAAAAPNNPFQQNVRVTFPVQGVNLPFRFKSVTDTLSVGTIVRLGKDWALNLEYNKTWTKSSGSNYSTTIPSAITTCLSSGAATCNGGPGLNPFQSPIDFTPYIYPDPTFVSGPYGSQFNNPSLRVAGPLFTLPGGKANLTVAVQRESTIIDTSRNSFSDGTATGRNYSIFPGRKQSTTSEYGEVTLPLVGAKSGIPLIRELELRAAIRHDAYFTAAPPGGDTYINYSLGNGAFYDQPGGFGSINSSDPNVAIPAFTRVESRFKSTNFTFAGRWSPLEGVMFRASYATGFLPPNVIQAAATTALGAQFTPDPFRGNLAEGYQYTVLYAGNPNLQPEKSRSLSAGVILTPFNGFRFSADYTRIAKKGELGVPTVALVLANPDLFPGRVVRAAPGAGDPAGYLGRIISIDSSPINFLRSQIQAIDFQADYAFKTSKWGDFRLYALATWQPDTVRQQTIGLRPLNFTGNSDGPLEVQGNAGIDWTIGKLAVRWNTQFYNSYNIYSTQDTSVVAGQNSVNSAIANQGARRVPSQSYSDLFLSYDFKDAGGVLGGVRVSGGVQNIFNSRPPIIAISSYNLAGYSTYGDPRLRRFTLSVRKSFGQ
ncbi:MAG: TonB-dependent receptor [Sphingomonas sp.]|uniref:TonB-dependent receptor n=1 Tax=Sphingomonas sp. TaxID=28214 RepID=UPI0026009C37|nr:TonB-dependent receptor [Sphingomonas sp.]MBX3563541.1 TonB-dependent receptor [Sphingomonas sp.]